jgi:Xaa-Pro aminopeptidase
MNVAKKLNYCVENMDAPLSADLRRRWDNLEKIMSDHDLDAVLIVGNSVVGSPALGSFRYFTGHRVYFQYQAILARPGKPIMICASSVLHKKALETRGFSDIRISPDIFGTVLSELNEHPVRRLGVSLDMLPALWYLELIKMKTEFVDIIEDISAIRSARSEFEIQATRICAKIADIGYNAVCDTVKPGVRLSDIHADLDYAMKRAGAEETFTLMSCGKFSFENNELPCIGPFSWPDDRVIKYGESVAMEISPRYMGYWTQMVRTICVGEPNPDLEIAHRDLCKTVDAALPLIKPGVKLEDVMEHMSEFGESLGYISRLPFGHVASIDLDEGWQYTLESDIVLNRGMTLIVHPTLVTPKIEYGIFWGDSYLVTEYGGECLTSCDNKLLTV